MAELANQKDIALFINNYYGYTIAVPLAFSTVSTRTFTARPL
jgi:hypothetical protein